MELLIGGIVSLIVQIIKKLVGTNTIGTLAILLVLSIVGAVIYISLKTAGLLQSALNILLIAAGIYAVLIKRFEK